MASFQSNVSGLCRARGRCEYGHYDEAVRAGIANGMQNPGGSKRRVASRQQLFLVGDTNHAAALKDEIHLVLALVDVRRMLLAKLE